MRQKYNDFQVGLNITGQIMIQSAPVKWGCHKQYASAGDNPNEAKKRY